MMRRLLPLLLLLLVLPVLAAKPPGKPKPPANPANQPAKPPKEQPKPPETVAVPATTEDLTPPATPGFGLHGEYFIDDALKSLGATRLDAKIDFQWGGGPAYPGLPADNFTCRWRGFILPKYAETYTFWASADDCSRITVDGTLLATTWPGETRKERGDIALTPDKLHTIIVEHREYGGGAGMSLYWSSKSQAQQVVPTEALYPPRIRVGKILFTDAGQGMKGKVYLLAGADAPKALTQPGATEPALDTLGDTAVFTACWTASWGDAKTVKNTELYIMKPDGTDQRRITTNFYPDMMPALSRDGKKLAFVADPNNGNRDIFIMPIGGRPRQLTDNPGMDLQPTFSPNGKQVAFQSERDGHMLLMAVNADGTEETQLVDGDGWNPVYSPDGKKLLFLSSRDGQTDIYLATLETKEVVRLTKSEDAEACPVFSPDGSEVAFIATSDPGKKDIFVMALDGKGLRRVTTAGNVVSFTWGW